MENSRRVRVALAEGVRAFVAQSFRGESFIWREHLARRVSDVRAFGAQSFTWSGGEEVGRRSNWAQEFRWPLVRNK
jgi:hypothetical protein